jgi:hypothetical protein
MDAADARVAREAKAMTRREVIVKAFAGVLSWVMAASLLRVSERRQGESKIRQINVRAHVAPDHAPPSPVQMSELVFQLDGIVV